jgi:hypothetical protein
VGLPSAEHVLGFRLWDDDDRSDTLPYAVALATQIHEPGMKAS